MTTHLEPDIQECKVKVKWELGNITTNKPSGADGIPVELFQILKQDAVKVLLSICRQIWKTQECPQHWKRSVFIPTQRKTMPRNVQTTAKLHSSHTLKVMLKILQARLQQDMHHELPAVQAGFRKGRGTRDQIANFCWIIEKVSSRKTSILLY